MPEYLAPAVYVEEVSFRPKPLEGVSTSTTSFVGPTATGPIDDIPELVTSVGEFERVYGGTSSLVFGALPTVNYLAHAVRAFFDNGGRRLYVARTFQASLTDTGVAQSAWLMAADGSAPNARFVARFPGRAGNAQVQLREERVPTTPAALVRALPGTLIRTGTAEPAGPAVVVGGRPPFVVPNGAELDLTLVEEGGAPTVTTLTFSGESAQLTGTPTLDGGGLFVVDATTTPLALALNGVAQTVSVPPGSYTLQQLVDQLNRALRGGFAVVDGTDIVIGSEVRGTASSVVITTGAAFGFTDGASADRASSADTVPDLGHVTAGDLAALLAGVPVSVTVDLERRVRLTTQAVGLDTTVLLEDDAAAPSAAAAMGFTTGVTTTGEDGTTIQTFVRRGESWLDSSGVANPLAGDLGGVELVSLNVVVIDADGHTKNFEELAYDSSHPRYVGNVLAAEPPRRSDALENRVALETNADTGAISWAFALRAGLLGGEQENVVPLEGGNDGVEPIGERYSEALERLRSIEDISIVAAPGSSALLERAAIRAAVLTHVERRRAYQIAVLDTPPGVEIGEARSYRADIDSKYAALYYPWVRIANPDLRPGDLGTPRELDVPPSGFVCGIYARNDTERGVYKAPANEVVRGALSLERFVNFAQQEVLNPAGVNVLRFFPGRGFRVWGARLVSSDPEWKYVSARRYFNYVEASIDRGTQWVVFEPNGPRLWQRVRNTISDFLFAEWRSGALLGSSAGEAFFVRADRSTMTQNDLDNGRLIVEVGIAIVNPAEFVIFRIGQKTADGRA